MSREDDEKEIRKIEYLERRGVATFDDRLRRKEISRKMALEDFEQSEGRQQALRNLLKESEPAPRHEIDKKGASN